jgi:feruloyl esterase
MTIRNVLGKANATCLAAIGVVMSTFVVTPSPAAAAACESLASLSIPFTTITAAQSVTGGTFVPPTGAALTGLPDFCRIALTVSPTSDSSIRVEVWMPNTVWNGRYQGLGGGGYTGSINYSALGGALVNGYATANTDMGTVPATGGNGVALVGHPEKWLDFGSRSTHEMTVAAKTVIQAFYQMAPQYSYFVGCSTGGHQGLEEAEVFPDDYDGIIAGAPGHNRTHLHADFVYDFAVAHQAPGSVISSAKLAMLNNAVLAACVGKDGGLPTDPFLTDPRRCHFDPASIQCSGGDAPNCLTASEVYTAAHFYDGLRNPRTGVLIYPGWVRGTETGWGGLQGTTQPDFPGIFNWALGASYNPLTVNFDTDMATVDATLAPSVNFMSTDLSRFVSHGGKLLIYQGFADPIVSTVDTLDYYGRIMSEQNLTLQQTQQFARVFLEPGMGHCSGGTGPNVFDTLTPMRSWVEQGIAPEQIIATKYVNNNVNAGVQMTRPLCLYPRKAIYQGTGDPNVAANFACIDDGTGLPSSELAGRDYLAPLVIQASAPAVFDTHANAGKFAVVLRAPLGSDDFHQWSPGNIKAEGAAAILGAPSLDGRTYSVYFKWSDLQNFFANAPAGNHIDLMITGTLQHNGLQSLFAASATVQVQR